MVKSLETIFRQEDKEIGINSNGNVGPKLIRNPYNLSEKRIIPGYENDFVWQNAKKVIDLNIGRLTASDANMSRNNWIIKRRTLTIPAVPEYIPRKKKIIEV